MTRAGAVDRQAAYVQEVLSGDTVRLKGGKTLKYAGLESPPLQHRIPLIRTYGENAKKFNEELVLNKKILIEWGPKLRDQRDNLLGYVYLEDGTFVNMEVLKSGNAKPRIITPNLNYAADFRKASRDAARESLGVWKEKAKDPYAQDKFYGEKNTKIYYLHNSPELARIPQANLVLFRSRVEASAAKYRPCSTCKENSPTDESETLYD